MPHLRETANQKCCEAEFLFRVVVIVSYRRKPVTHSDNQDLNATVNVYVLVTSATPLTAFVHHTALVKTHLDETSYAIEVRKHFPLSESFQTITV